MADPKRGWGPAERRQVGAAFSAQDKFDELVRRYGEREALRRLARLSAVEPRPRTFDPAASTSRPGWQQGVPFARTGRTSLHGLYRGSRDLDRREPEQTPDPGAYRPKRSFVDPAELGNLATLPFDNKIVREDKTMFWRPPAAVATATPGPGRRPPPDFAREAKGGGFGAAAREGLFVGASKRLYRPEDRMPARPRSAGALVGAEWQRGSDTPGPGSYEFATTATVVEPTSVSIGRAPKGMLFATKAAFGEADALAETPGPGSHACSRHHEGFWKSPCPARLNTAANRESWIDGVAAASRESPDPGEYAHAVVASRAGRGAGSFGREKRFLAKDAHPGAAWSEWGGGSEDTAEASFREDAGNPGRLTKKQIRMLVLQRQRDLQETRYRAHRKLEEHGHYRTAAEAWGRAPAPKLARRFTPDSTKFLEEEGAAARGGAAGREAHLERKVKSLELQLQALRIVQAENRLLKSHLLHAAERRQE